MCLDEWEYIQQCEGVCRWLSECLGVGESGSERASPCDHLDSHYRTCLSAQPPCSLLTIGISSSMSFDEEEDEDENSSSSSQLNSNTRPSSATSRKSIRVSEEKEPLSPAEG